MTDGTPDVEFELTDLRAPSQTIPTGDAPARRRLFPRRWLVFALAAALVVAASGAGLDALLVRQRQTFAHQHPLGLNPVRDGITILQSAAWSPDGAQIALLGQTAADADEAAIYSAVGPQLQTTIALDPPIVADYAARFPRSPMPGRRAADNSTTTVSAHGLTWSPDGRTVIVPFTIVTFTPQEDPTPKVTIQALGVALFPRAGGRPRVVLAPGGGSYAAPLLWNLQAGTVAAPPPDAQGTTLPFPLAPAYRWTGDALAPLSGSAAGPVGQPDGGAQFTLWQPGTLTTRVGVVGANDANQPFVFYTAAIIAVSPDGRALAEPGIGAYTANTRVAVNVPALPAPALLDRFPYVVVGARDPALVAVQQAGSQAFLAWSPIGTWLAAYHPPGNVPGAWALDLYPTASGTPARRLDLNHYLPPTSPFGVPVLAWSPDGRQLLLIDLAQGVAQIVPIATATLGSQTPAH